ncbi:hypothetical protein LTR62_002726 [Meristemomyces frigidus]|uniref:HTH APSES-type domain-containing protein n=1 Tax=Meristemomyces frigidus TaxID=1508187 RepID=A0AAN7TGM0_9PEZI|nr:hypothetical protein LTR62_002726 [Meristemomyces frigidus]
MAARGSLTVYSATYSNVPVYELNVAGNHIMRRRADDWINATHILKVAEYDKPARTRILEREVQKGVHEKVQGGYGKYQGTWIPLPDGRELATKNGVLEKLRPIFDYVPGDRSPPPAPKHETAASSKPRAPRQSAAAARKAAPAANMYHHNPQQQNYDQMDVHSEPPGDNETVALESQFDEYDVAAYTGGSRKRRRVEDQTTQADREHHLWAEEFLDYFIMLGDPSMDALITSPPLPPQGIDINRPIDEKGHTALHWAAAIGDLETVKDLIRRGASVDAQSKSGETPLMRSVIFTNCFDKRCMDRLAQLLIRTVNMQAWSGATVFHHVAAITQSKKKYECARYYIDCILGKMVETLSPGDVERVLNEQDRNGDTAITIAARHGARKCVRSLIGRNAAVDIMNLVGETADQLIVQLNHRRQERNQQFSSSPFQGNTMGGAVQSGHSHSGVAGTNGGIPFDPLIPHTSLAAHSASSALAPSASAAREGRVVFKSEVALTLTSSLLPTIITKTRSLAAALDAELEERDAEVAEAERVVALRKTEIEGMIRQDTELRAKEVALGDEELGGNSELDLEAVIEECAFLIEKDEAANLADLIRSEERNAASSPLPSSSLSDDLDDPESAATQLALARHLSSLQTQRRELIKQIVSNLALANYLPALEGKSGGEASRDKQQAYRRLITGALGVREEDVEALLPEMLEELEESRGLSGGLGGVEGMALGVEY